jgi:2-oxoglutarate ferredoxin oxidoreductase subunit beta
MKLQTPEMLKNAHSGFCPGCGHGIIGRIIAEVISELGYEEDYIQVVDVACGSLYLYCMECDIVMAAHGRPIITAAGIKRVRKNNPVIAYIGDGAAYSIGMAHTIWSALRNEKITAIVINNGVFGMTGGQMAPTTLLGQKTTSSPYGRTQEKAGEPVDIIKLLGKLDIAYLARGSVDSVGNINKTKQYIKKALEKQMNNEGFSLIEVLSPCPTNWNLSPIDSMKRIKDVVSKEFELGEFVERSAR